MTETTSASASPATTTTTSASVGISPSDIVVGMQVEVERRMWPGINQPGGHAFVVKIHYRDDDEVHGDARGVDIRYVLGGRESGVELGYLRPHVELARGGRSRRRDTKMNLAAPEKKKIKKKAPNKKRKTPPPKKASAGNTGKKRKALAPLDGNRAGKAVDGKVAKKGKDAGEDRSPKKAAAAAAAGDGKWTLIQDGAIADHAPALEEGRRVSYWWSDEDGWLPGSVGTSLARVVTASTIGWKVGVDFDNGDSHALAFHPQEKRWRVPAAGSAREEPTEPEGEGRVATDAEGSEKAEGGTRDEEVEAKATKKPAATRGSSSAPKSNAAAQPKGGEKKSASNKSIKPAGENNDKLKGAKKIKAEAAKNSAARSSSLAPKSNDTTQTKGGVKEQMKQNQSTNKFTKEKYEKLKAKAKAEAEAKVKAESAMNFVTAQSFFSTLESDAASENEGGGKQQTNKKQPTPSFKTQPQSKIKEASSKTTGAAAAAARPPSPVARGAGASCPHARGTATLELKKSEGSLEYAKSLKEASQSKATVMQGLHRAERDRAERFVDNMVGISPSKAAARGRMHEEEGEDSDLELKMNQGRTMLFNSTLTEIMFRKGIDTLDVGEMLKKMNEYACDRHIAESSWKPFTLLEIRPYLRKLHDEDRIFLVEEEGSTGVVYAI